MNEATKAHGLDGTLVEPDWPPLNLDEVRTLLRSFPDCWRPDRNPILQPAPLFSCKRHQNSPRKSLHQAPRPRCPRCRRPGGRASIHGTILRANGIEVPRVFATAAGETAVEIGDWTYEVHGIPAGHRSLRRRDLVDVHFVQRNTLAPPVRCWLASTLPRRHYDAPPRNPRPLVASFSIFASQDARGALEQYLAARPDAEHDTCRLAAIAKRRSIC